MDSFKVLIVGVVYNDDGKFLVASRSKQEKLMPGIYSYHVGAMNFDEKEKFNALEKSLHAEVQDEAGVKVDEPVYIGSQQYIEDGEKTLAVAFLSKHLEGEPTSATSETESITWMDIDEIRKLETTPIVHEVYEAANNKLLEKRLLHRLSVAGLILNNKNEFMLVPDASAKEGEELFTFPVFEVTKHEASTWEVVAKSLAQNLKQTYNIVLEDGAIPFTDQSFDSTNDFDGVVEFYIAKAKEIGDVENISWKNFSDFDSTKMRPSIYNIFALASKFMSELAQPDKQ